MDWLNLNINSRILKKEYPGWHALIKKLTEKRLTLSDAMKCVDKLTKRRVHYWMDNGIPLTGEHVDQKWRKFSLIDLLIFAIASEFKEKNIEVTKLPVFKGEFVLKRTMFQPFPYVQMVYGYDVFLCTDLETFYGHIPAECIQRSEYDVNINVWLPNKDTSFIVAVSLKNICDKLIQNIEQNLDLPDFRVNILPDGGYKFSINGVPVALEPLKIEDQDTVKPLTMEDLEEEITK